MLFFGPTTPPATVITVTLKLNTAHVFERISVPKPATPHLSVKRTASS